MSSGSRITDDEMRYYQFKARQQYLIKKEDHEWNEFCKKNKCSCCSCQPLNIPMVQRDVGIQATLKPATKLNQNTLVKRTLEMPISKSLNELKTELEKLKLAFADVQLNRAQDGKEIIEKTSTDNKLLGNESALNLLNGERQNFIRTSLLNSLQRLHLSAAPKITKPVIYPSSRNKSFFLPSVLERQRLISRNAYLSSLINKPKVIGKTKAKPLDNKVKTPTKNNKKLPQNIPSKTRKGKIAPTVELKKEKTLIQSEESIQSKDENIENVVDAIVEDLLGEEILALNRIRYMKLEKNFLNPMKAKNIASTKLKEATKKEIHLSHPSPETRAKIKQIPFFDLITKKPGSSSLLKNSSQSHPADTYDQSKSSVCPTNVKYLNTHDEHTRSQTPPTKDKETQAGSNKQLLSKPFRTIHSDQKLIKNITKQRKLFFQYLEKISRARSVNFDPVALSNMVAESLLNDCIADICEELDEVPTSLIADLYKQEFTTTL